MYLSSAQLFDLVSQTSVIVYAFANVATCVAFYLLVRYDFGLGYNVRRFAAALLPAVLGGVSTVLLKCTLLLIESPSSFSDWRTFCILGVTIFIPVLQLGSLNSSLRRFEALFVTPVYQSSLIISCSVGGIACFQHLSEFSTLQLVLFPVGVLVTALGVFLLTLPKDEVKELSAEAADEVCLLSSLTCTQYCIA